MKNASMGEIGPMSAATVPGRRKADPSWRVAALGFTLSLTATTALALGLATL